MTDGDEVVDGFRVSSLATTVYLPGFLFAIGRGAAIPVLPLLALDLGASPAAAGAIVALRGIGTMLLDIPGGVFVERMGDRRAMAIATAVLGIVGLAIAARPSLAVYGGLVLAMGGAWAIWSLARLTYATEFSPRGHRGRVMSVIGGVERMGEFLGPLLGGLAIIPLGLAGPFLLQALLALAALGALLVRQPPPNPDLAIRRAAAVEVTMRRVVREHRRTLTVAGSVAVTLQVLRAARQAVIPLWGDAIGLSASSVSVVFSMSSIAEVALFYPVGVLMDRKGRKWAGVPCLVLLALGMALIPTTASVVSLGAVAVLLGLANGLGSGINSTLGSDLSPAVGRNHFFGAWRFIGDVGTAGGPLLVAVTTSLVSLAAGSLVVAVTGVAGALVLALAVPESLTPPPPARDHRAHKP